MKEFQAVRNWGEMRGLGSNSELSLDKRLQSQFQRVQQEVTEIHEAIVLEDWEEFEDAIGDTIVTLVNIANINGMKAEDCLEGAFGVIELRKGITRPTGDFVRYAKLSDELKLVCDQKQGSPGEQYFAKDMLGKLGPDDFKA